MYPDTKRPKACRTEGVILVKLPGKVKIYGLLAIYLVRKIC